MTEAEELEEIGRRHGSDKWTGHLYAEPYAAHLSSLRSRSISLLEIGVGGYNDSNNGGHSLRAWKEFFPKAAIYGLDFFDKAPLQEDRIKIYKGSQADPRVISHIMADNPDGFDVVIDDGSHISEHVISTFYMIWQHVKKGGWYIAEDLQTSYWPAYGGKLHDTHHPLAAMGFFKSLIDGLNWQEIHQPGYVPSSFDTQIQSMHFYHNMLFIHKGNNNEGSTQVVANRIAGV